MNNSAQIFQSRRAFGAAYAVFDAWFAAQTGPGAQQIWEQFAATLLGPFEAQSETVWHCGVHPSTRARLATLLCVAAHAKMQLDNGVGDPNFDPHEGQLWDAALRVSRRAVENWEAQLWQTRGEFGGVYLSARHRLADLYRRAGRTDERAMRLYIEVFSGTSALAPTTIGAGAHISVDALLQRGAALTLSSAPAEIAARYSLCLLLKNRGYAAPWIATSLHVARAHTPQTNTLSDYRVALTAARDLKRAQMPIIARLAAALTNLAAERQLEAEERAREGQAAITRELQAMARARAEASKPKRKRKARPNSTPIPLPPKDAARSKDQLEFDKLFDEAFGTPAPPAPPTAPPVAADEDDWDDFLAEFERDL